MSEPGSGSRRLEVLLLSKYGRLGASSRVRSYQYLPYLERDGIRVRTSCLLDDGYVRAIYEGRRYSRVRLASAYAARVMHLLGARRFDLLWIEYELFPWLPAVLETALSPLRDQYIVDFDDAVFHRYDLSPRPTVRRLLSGKIPRVVRNASLVMAGNDYLAQWAETNNARRVERIPSVVDTTRLLPSEREAGAEFRIGWVGSPATVGYLPLVQGPLARVSSEPGSSLTVVGAATVDLDGVRVERRPWSEETEAASIGEFDVGIMPLPDDAWARGKCGYKLLLYMACGIPVVASPVGANRQIVEHGVDGFLAGSATEWVDALSILRRDPKLRRRMGRAGRDKVVREYSLEVMAPKMCSLIRLACG